MGVSKKPPKMKRPPGRFGRMVRAPGRALRAFWEWWRVKVFRRPARVPGRKTPVLVASKRINAEKSAKRRAMAKRITVSTLKVTGLVVLIGAALIMFFEKRMIFPSTKWPEGFWEDAERELPGRVEVELTAEDGVRIHGWWVPHDPARSPKPRATVLFFHGNAGNLSHRSSWLAWLRERGCQAFCIDYRGYGRSEGAPSEKGLYRDARAAYDYCVKEQGVDPSQILLMGRSLGCAVAVELATDSTRPVAAVVLEAPFISIGEMSKRVIPVIPVRWVLATRMDNRAKVPHLHQPLWLVHGAADSLIPVDHGRAVFAAAGGTPKSMFEVPNGDHNDPHWLNVEYRRRFEQFVTAHVKPGK